LAPSIDTSSSGLDTAMRAASEARLSPDARPIALSAEPESLMIDLTPAKSPLTRPGMVIVSEMPWIPSRNSLAARAKSLVEESRAILQELGNQRGVVDPRRQSARIAETEGDREQARAAFQEILDHSRAIGDAHLAALTLGDLGRLAWQEQDYARAQALWRESLEGLALCGHPWCRGWALAHSGMLAVHHGSFERGVWLLGAAILYLVIVFAGVILAFGFIGLASALKAAGIAIAVIFGIIFGLAIVCFALIVLVAYNVGFYVCVIERRSFVEAFSAGIQRVFNRVGFVRALYVGLAYLAIGIGVWILSLVGQGLLFGLLRSHILGTAFGTLVSVAIAAFLTAFLTIFYFDLRVREEGLDLLLAAEAPERLPSAPA